MLKVYLADIGPLREKALFEEKLKLIRGERRERLLRYHASDDRCRGLAAGLLLKKALEQENISYDEAVFICGKNGKPYLQDSAVFFSLSHAGEWAACAICDCEIGIDVERLSRFDGQEQRMGRIAERILTPQELKLWQSARSGEALVRLWTQKESYIKYTGEGLACDLSGIDTLQGLFFQHIEMLRGYDISVCSGNTPLDKAMELHLET
jgi:4'-phosphopantetheinyl transferase